MKPLLLSSFVLLLLALSIPCQGQEIGNGIEPVSYRNPGQAGFGAVLDIVASPLLQPNLILGYHFGPHVFLGAGAGVMTYVRGFSVEYIPVFVQTRVSLGDWRWSPFFSIDFGFYPGQIQKRPITWKELYFSPTLGVRLRNRDRSKRSSFWFGITLQGNQTDWPFCPFPRIAYSF